ncbi:hypothetical protein ACJX0J_026838, partial [Zea mays]
YFYKMTEGSIAMLAHKALWIFRSIFICRSNILAIFKLYSFWTDEAVCCRIHGGRRYIISSTHSLKLSKGIMDSAIAFLSSNEEDNILKTDTQKIDRLAGF